MVPAWSSFPTAAGFVVAACGEAVPGGQRPAFAVYLLARDPGPFDWPHRWVRWPDFRTPASTVDAISALAEAYERAAR